MKRKKVLPTVLMLAFLCLATVRLTAANPILVPPLRMPEEYINVTISLVDETLWTEVEGTYPLYKFDVGDQDPRVSTDGGEVAFVGDTEQTSYPVPPGATNISVRMNETELNWINFTSTHPEFNATHHTFIGDWPLIYWNFTPVPDFFTIRIEYEHPILTKDGTYMFLYDLNTVDYLSPWGNKSTARFNIRLEINCSSLYVYTVDANETMNPVNYSVTMENSAQILCFTVVSEYSKPLPGDLLLTFASPSSLTQPQGFLGTGLPWEYGYGMVALIVGAIITVTFSYLRRKH